MCSVLSINTNESWEGGPGISAGFRRTLRECSQNVERNGLEASLSFLMGFWQFLEQVWGASMSFLVGFWHFLEQIYGASMSFQESFW